MHGAGNEEAKKSHHHRRAASESEASEVSEGSSRCTVVVQNLAESNSDEKEKELDRRESNIVARESRLDEKEKEWRHREDEMLAHE